MRNVKLALALAGAMLLSIVSSAFAQKDVTYAKVEPTWFQQGKVSGGVSVTAVTGATLLPTAGSIAWICNTGSNDAYLAFGASNVAATITGSSWLKAGTCGNYDLWPPFSASKTGAYLAAITASSTTTLTVETGLGSGPQQLASSGGGGGAVTIADGADVAQGAIADAASSVGGTGTLSAKLRRMTTQLDAIQTGVLAPTPAGTNAIGNVGGFDVQLAPTVTVQNAAYSAGNSLGGLITITGAARTNGGAGNVTSQRLKSTGGSTNTIWIYAWSKTPVATCTDKAAFVASATDNAYALPGFPTSVTLGGSPGAWDTATYAQITGLYAAFKNQDTSPGTPIYQCWVTAGSVTPATTGDLTTIIGVAQD